MIAQLDQGFTLEGFVANFATQALAAFVGTVGAFVVAWLFYRKQSKDDRATFEETLAHQRKLLQDQFAHDLKVRRDEDQKRQNERDAAEDEAHWQTLRRIAREIEYDRRLVRQISIGAGLILLRSEAIDKIFALSKPVPDIVELDLMRSLFAIGRYNWHAQSGSDAVRALRDAQTTLEEAMQTLSDYLRS